MAWQLTILAAVRVGAFMMVAPLLGNRQIPWWTRLAIVVLVSLALAPLGATPGEGMTGDAACWGVGPFVDRLIAELMTGLMLGLGVSVLVSAATMAGQILAQMSGLSWPASESENNSAVTQLVWMVSLVVFVLMKGPELMLSALADTFVSIPAGQNTGGTNQLEFVTNILTHSFWLALRGVGPAVAALWIGMLGITLLVRVLPQAGCLQLGMDAGMAAFWLAIVLTVCGGVWIWMDDLDSWMHIIRDQAMASTIKATPH